MVGCVVRDSWAYVAWTTYSGGERLSVPATLYFLQLAAEPLLFVAFALVVDMWYVTLHAPVLY